jgi:hypothetical protein
MKDLHKRSNIALNGRGGANIKITGNKTVNLSKTPQKTANMKAIVHYINDIESGINNSLQHGSQQSYE